MRCFAILLVTVAALLVPSYASASGPVRKAAKSGAVVTAKTAKAGAKAGAKAVRVAKLPLRVIRRA
jgi:hypothetical protein